MGLLILIYIAVQSRIAYGFRVRITQTAISYFESKALGERIMQAEKRLTDTIESFPDEFALFDMDDNLVLCNSRYS